MAAGDLYSRRHALVGLGALAGSDLLANGAHTPPATADDDALVRLTDVEPSISVTKTGDQPTVAESGELVTFLQEKGVPVKAPVKA
jgi:hypothetical protein